MQVRSVITLGGFDASAAKVYGRNDWDKAPAFVAVEWVLSRAKTLATYTQTGTCKHGPIRIIKIKPVGATSHVCVYFYERDDGAAMLVDVFPVP